MQYSAKKRGKYVPTDQELETLFAKVKSSNMVCKHCGKTVIMTSKEGCISEVVTLQHNKDRTLDLICHTCNTGEGNCKHNRPFDMPEGKYICSKCGVMKNASEFGFRANSFRHHVSACKKCRAKDAIIYRKLHPEKVKESNKKWWEKNGDEYNARRKTKRRTNKKAAPQGDTHLSGTFLEKQLAGG